MHRISAGLIPLREGGRGGGTVALVHFEFISGIARRTHCRLIITNWVSQNVGEVSVGQLKLSSFICLVTWIYSINWERWKCFRCHQIAAIFQNYVSWLYDLARCAMDIKRLKQLAGRLFHTKCISIYLIMIYLEFMIHFGLWFMSSIKLMYSDFYPTHLMQNVVACFITLGWKSKKDKCFIQNYPVILNLRNLNRCLIDEKYFFRLLSDIYGY